MKTLKIMIMVLALFLAQYIFSSYLNILGIFPDLFLIFLAYLAFRISPFWLIWAAFFIGLTQDMFFNTSLIGLSSIVKILYSLVLIKIAEYERSINEILVFILVAVLMLVAVNLYDSLYYFGIRGEGYNFFTHVSLPKWFYSAVLLFLSHYYYPLAERQ